MVNLARDVRARRWAGLAIVLALALTLGCAPKEDAAVAKARAVLQQTVGANLDYERYALTICKGSTAPEARELILEKIGSDNFQTAMEAVNALGDDPFPVISSSADYADALKLFSQGHLAILVTENGATKGILTKSDLVDYMLAELG